MELTEQEQAELKKDLLAFVKKASRIGSSEEVAVLPAIVQLLLYGCWGQKVTFGKSKSLVQEGEVVIVPQPLIPEQGDRWSITCSDNPH